MQVEHWGLGSSTVDYRRAWQRQQQIHSEVVAGRRPDTVLLLEHDPVYTAGRRTARWERPTDGTEVVDVDRGGRITWHGPGQLIVYPIVRLAAPVDVLAFVRALEQAVIEVAAEWGVSGARVAGRSGVWLPGRPNRKLAAVGIRVARGVSMHGVAVNACPDLTNFDPITPCGIPDAATTSLTEATGRTVTPLDIAAATERHLRKALEPCLATPPPAGDHAATAAAVVEPVA